MAPDPPFADSERAGWTLGAMSEAEEWVFT